MLNTTLSELDKIISRVNTHPEYSGCIAREKYHTLREEAEKHSLEIELVGERRKIGRKEREYVLERLSDYNIRDNRKKVKTDLKFEEKVALVKIYPGQEPDILDYYLKKGYKGLVLEMSGLGHVPG